MSLYRQTAYFVVALFMISALAGIVQGSNDNSQPINMPNSINNANLQAIPGSMLPNTTGITSFGFPSGSINVMVTFNFSNQTSLNNYLKELSNPSSPQYHKYLSQAQFDRLYGPSSSFYSDAVNYFRSAGNAEIQTFSDHLSIDLIGTAGYFSSAFHTNLSKFGSTSKWYYSVASSPELPSWLAGSVYNVVGLSNYSTPSLNVKTSAINSSVSMATPTKDFGYPNPVQYNGEQLVWGSDFQVAYNEQQLLNTVLPENVSIATILWSGNDSSGYTAPFYPKDVYTYLNQTLAPGQPDPVLHGVPLNGAPAPGISATSDTTSAAFENTLDLEMAGSTAPGSNIYNVYTISNSFSSLDQCFAYIMNADAATNPGLANVSVISNSWYAGSYTDLTWNHYLQEAQARGITVLASSGDSGDNASSTKYLGSDASYPGTAAYNTYGMLSVGGTAVTLSTTLNQQSYLKIENQSAWYGVNQGQKNVTYIGSQGGIDTLVNEPNWQVNSVANSLIQGKGRGVPDIGAIANNTIMYITTQAGSYYDNPYFYAAWGTSISAPLEAGIIAEMNAYLNRESTPNLGFMDPILYKLGNFQYGTLAGESLGSNYTFLMPFYDVLYGANAKYSEEYAYSLVTGLGSINAYNMTMDILHGFPNNSLYRVSVNITVGQNENITGTYINNEKLQWEGSFFNMFLSNGSYSYNVTFFKGTTEYFSNGTFNVSGAPKNVSILLSNNSIVQNKNPQQNNTSPVISLLAGGNLLFYALAVILLLILIISLAMRKKK